MAATLVYCVGARDAVATGRAPMRLRGAANGGLPKVRLSAPLYEEVGGTVGSSKSWQARQAGAGSAEEEAAKAREEVRALQRAAKREKRGAVRELKRDRAFVVAEVDRVAAERDEERKGVTKRLMSELEVLQATHNQQVGKRKAKPLTKDDPARLPAHLAWKASREFGKTKADRVAGKRVGGAAAIIPGKRRESKGPHQN